MRLFFGLEIPASVRSGVASVQSLLRAAGADVRWVPPENAHLTLRFLGEVDRSLLPALRNAGCRAAAALGEPRPRTESRATPRIRAASPRVRAAGLGTFPERGPARVVWVGIQGAVAALAHARRTLDDEIDRLECAVDGRPFHPHLTLGGVRARGHRRSRRLPVSAGGTGDDSGTRRNQHADLRALIDRKRDVDLGEWAVRGVVLFESRLSPRGARYTPLERFRC